MLEQLPAKNTSQNYDSSNPTTFFPLTRSNLKANLTRALHQFYSYGFDQLQQYKAIPNQLYTPDATFTTHLRPSRAGMPLSPSGPCSSCSEPCSALMYTPCTLRCHGTQTSCRQLCSCSPGTTSQRLLGWTSCLTSQHGRYGPHR